MGHNVQPVTLRKGHDPGLFAVGDDTELDPRDRHFRQPGQHFLRRLVRRIRDDGIIKIQHQQRNAPLLQQLRRQVRDRARHDARQK